MTKPGGPQRIERYGRSTFITVVATTADDPNRTCGSNDHLAGLLASRKAMRACELSHALQRRRVVA
jgi:hypothetical protein